MAVTLDSIADLVREHAAACPDSVAVEDGERRLTYAELDRASAPPLTASWPAGPDRMNAAPGEVHLWLAALDDPAWPGPEDLPAPERERAAAFLREDAAARWVASRWALRRVLARYLGEPAAEIEIGLGERKKPQLAGGANGLAFNLSHSRDLALVGVTRDREVGVDVEEIEPARDLVALAERALAPEAVTEIRATAPPDQPLAFYREWTRHEARLKCLGVGLGGPDGGEPGQCATSRPAPATPLPSPSPAVTSASCAAGRCRPARPPRPHPSG